MISVKEALTKVLSTSKIIGIEEVPVQETLGRILARDIHADRPIPPFHRVTMDGIAIKYERFEQGQRVFAIESIGAAGAPTTTLHDSEKCVEIMTGAPLPNETDTVIRYEDLEKTADGFKVLAEVEFNKNVHSKGSDHKTNEVLLMSGSEIKAIDINVLASVGMAQVPVFKLPRVAVISSGDELVHIETTPKDYQIRKSNVYMLAGKLVDLGVHVETFHFIDNSNEILDKLKLVLSDFDVLLMSGGVSKGKFDFIPDVLDKLGFEKLFHRVAQRPGKPFWFGKKESKTVFAFPGNPVSTLSCFYKYFMPWFYQSIGIKKDAIKVVLDSDVTFKPDLTYFAQASLRQSNDGRWLALVNHGNGSGDMVNPTKMNGFIELPRGKEVYRKGEVVDFIPF